MAFKDFSLENLNRKAVGVGGLVVMSAFLLFAFTWGTLGLFESRYDMTGVFDNVAGLKTGADVRRAGVVVGEVTRIEPRHDLGHVVVHWRIDEGVNLGPETRAVIAAGTLFGNEFLRLEGPVVEPYLQDGHELPSEQTYTAVQVVEAFDQATRSIEELDVETFSEVLALVAEVGSENIGKFDSLFDSGESLTTVIDEHDEDLRQLLANGRELAELLQRKDQELFRLVDAASVLLGEIDARRDTLARLLGGGADAVRDLTEFVQQHRVQIEATLGDANTILARAVEDRENLNTMLAFLGPGFEGLARSFDRQADWLNFVVYSVGPIGGGPSDSPLSFLGGGE
jgi:phospholipid/cholesterol/gamma-HCH transport system substrate-binding protein